MGKKKPLKEKHQLKERLKIESEVFDRTTLLILHGLMKKGLIETVDYPISTGKEANVFRATTPDGSFVAIKIYKIETKPFLRREDYLEGDPRFRNIRHSDKAITEAFARKEFKNLEICEKAKVHAPKPLYLKHNVLVLGFLGEDGLPYPTMDTVGPRGEADLKSVLDDIRKMYRAGLVHADISEYNLLLGKTPLLIDFGQGVITRHPNAEKFLERDVGNVIKYFSKFGIKRDLGKVLEWIRR
ncbi:MAG: serine protein kinase RIO [Candidatus Micrarchaeota archaeon]